MSISAFHVIALHPQNCVRQGKAVWYTFVLGHRLRRVLMPYAWTSAL